MAERILSMEARIDIAVDLDAPHLSGMTLHDVVKRTEEDWLELVRDTLLDAVPVDALELWNARVTVLEEDEDE